MKKIILITLFTFLVSPVFAEPTVETNKSPSGSQQTQVDEDKEVQEIFDENSGLTDKERSAKFMDKVEQWSKVEDADLNSFMTVINRMSEAEAAAYLRQINDEVKEYKTPEKLIRHGALLGDALKKNPNNNVLMYGLADLLLTTGDLDSSIGILLELEKRDPNFPYLASALGYFYMNNGEAVKATAYYHQSVKDIARYASRDKWMPYNNLGILYERLGKLDESIKFYKQSIEVGPAEPFPHQNLANLYYQKKRYDEALSLALKASSLRSYPIVHDLISDIYLAQKKYDLAITEAKKAIELFPEFADAWANLASAQKETGQLQEAQAGFQKVLELDPAHYWSMLELSEIYRRRGDYKKTLEMARASIRYDQSSGYARWQIYSALSAINNSPLGESTLKKNYDDGYQIRTEGDSLFAKHQYKEAMDKYLNALKYNSYDDWAQMKVGQCYFAANDYPAAETYFKKAYKINPYGEEIVKSLAFVLVNENKTDEYNQIVREFTARMPETKAFVEILEMGGKKK